VSAPFAAFFVFSLLTVLLPGFKGQPIDPWVRVFLILLEESFFAIFVVCLLGLIWAIWTPGWVERLIEKFAGHAMLALLFMMIMGGILFVV